MDQLSDTETIPVSEKSTVVFAVMMAAFVVVLVLTNIIGVKLFLAFPETLPNGIFGEAITLTTGLITYPITFYSPISCVRCSGAKKRTLRSSPGS